MPTKIVTVSQMRAIEAAADKAGVTYSMMMEAAGRAVAQNVLARLADNVSDCKVVVLCGPGNNGGDGLVVAYYLADAGAPVCVYLVAPRSADDANLQRVRQKGLSVLDAAGDSDRSGLKAMLAGAGVLIDAIFGTGARLPLTGTAAEVLALARSSIVPRRAAGPTMCVAVDCPSGLDCDTGALDPAAIPADLTVTFAAAKAGQFIFPGADAVGELVVADIGVPPNLAEYAEVKVMLGTAEDVRAMLPPRPRSAHKGTFGRVLVVAGSVNYTGAAYLAGAAAYRAGAGLVTLAVPAPLHPILASRLPEATWVILPHELGVIAAEAAGVLAEELPNSQALLLGPGWGRDKTTAAFLRRLVRAEVAGISKGRIGFVAADTEAETVAGLPPLVIDADGLRLLAGIEGWPRRLPVGTVLTPHPGEMAALTGLEKDAVQADRVGVARRFAAEWGHVVVLKGAFTVVAAPDGRLTLQPFATAALARAGTGDVLAGAIAGLLAQGIPAYEAAVAGTYLHGLAGGLAARALGSTAAVMAGDVLDALPEALAEINSA